MAQTDVTLTFRCGFRWWVWPYVRLAAFNQSIGIPVDVAALADTIKRRGLWIEVRKGNSWHRFCVR